MRAADAFTLHQRAQDLLAANLLGRVRHKQDSLRFPLRVSKSPGEWHHGDCNDIICTQGGQKQPCTSHTRARGRGNPRSLWARQGRFWLPVQHHHRLGAHLLQRLCPLLSTATLFTLDEDRALCQHLLHGGCDCIATAARHQTQCRFAEWLRLEGTSADHLVQKWLSALAQILFVLLHPLQIVQGMLRPSSLGLLTRCLGKIWVWNLFISFCYIFSKSCHVHFEGMVWHSIIPQPSFAEGKDHLRVRWWGKQGDTRTVLGVVTQSMRETGLLHVMGSPTHNTGSAEDHHSQSSNLTWGTEGKKKGGISSKHKTEGNNLQERQSLWWWDQRRRHGPWARGQQQARHSTARLGELPPPPPSADDCNWTRHRRGWEAPCGADGMWQTWAGKKPNTLGKLLSQGCHISKHKEFVSHNYF